MLCATGALGIGVAQVPGLAGLDQPANEHAIDELGLPAVTTSSAANDSRGDERGQPSPTQTMLGTRVLAIDRFAGEIAAP